MTVQTFRNLLKERPFKPFRLVMSSGQTYEVRHPEMALITKSDILIGVDIDDDEVPAEFKICSMLHVTRAYPQRRISRIEKLQEKLATDEHG